MPKRVEIILRTETLQEHIERKNISQNGFAIKAQISSAYLTQMLKGTRRPSGKMREKLIFATGLEFDKLFIVQKAEAIHA